MALRTDYKDDILDISKNEKRKYNMITNPDGTVSFEDVTVYSQVGDTFGAADVNTITVALNNTEGSVRYNSETDMIQIRDAEGVWHDWAGGGLKQLELYVNGINSAKFTGYAFGTGQYGATSGLMPTLTFGNALKVSLTSSAVLKIGSAISDAIDVTKYSKLKFHCKSGVSGANGASTTWVCLMDSRTAGANAILQVTTLEGNKTFYEQDAEIDISALSGEYYVGICVQLNTPGGTIYSEISDMIMI